MGIAEASGGEHGSCTQGERRGAPIRTADIDCPDLAGALLAFNKLNEWKP